MRKKMSKDMKDIGCRIRHARRMADLTQKQLAEVIGTTPQYLSSLERGNIGTSIGTLMNICSALNVSADYILFAEKRIAFGLATGWRELPRQRFGTKLLKDAESYI